MPFVPSLLNLSFSEQIVKTRKGYYFFMLLGAGAGTAAGGPNLAFYEPFGCLPILGIFFEV